MLMRHVVGIVAVSSLLLWSGALAYAQYDYGPPPARGQSGKTEAQLTTAIDHAKFSAGSNAVNSAVGHLGHVLNCIEGTKGKNFNASWGHVCEGQGDGIVVDIRGAKNAGSVTLVLEAADSLAVAGVKTKDLGAVQNAARGVGALLQIVLNAAK